MRSIQLQASALALTLVLCAVGPARAESLSCPAAASVTLSAIVNARTGVNANANPDAGSKVWRPYDVAQAFDAPKLVLSNMRVTPNQVWCQYDVGGGTVRLLLQRACKRGAGTWTPSGELFHVCAGPVASACVAECSDP